MLKLTLIAGLLLMSTPMMLSAKDGVDTITVEMKTNMGTIMLELWPKEAPKTVENFMAYAKEGFFSNTIFHRVIDGFMIQGGGFDAEMEQKASKSSVVNEATNGKKNDRGTIAMARTSEVDSATAQFFINLVDNEFLNHRNTTPSGFGYCVFGKVTEGMEVIDEIAKVKTATKGYHQDVPKEAVVIEDVSIILK